MMITALESSIALARTLEPVGSPCTDVCKLNTETGYCNGCMRTRDEIKAWRTLPDADKLRVFELLLERQSQLTSTHHSTRGDIPRS
jgi:predicted Fe-S protein YdhL (DUF1289 family)